MTMRMCWKRLSRAIMVGGVAALAACASGETPARTTAVASPEVRAEGAGNNEARATCVATFTRQRVCTDVYIPALVDLRTSLDRPPGIAAAVAEEGRDAIIAQALGEWSEDSKDEKIAAVCEQMIASRSATWVSEVVTAAGVCLQESGCQGFVDCVIPIMQNAMTH